MNGWFTMGNRGPKAKEAFDGIRTRDLSLTKRVLCQLSYEGNKLMENPGFDPGASSLLTTHSTD